jgi:hypothetical protein
MLVVMDGSSTVATRPAIDFAAIRSQLQIRDVLELLGFQPQGSSGKQLRGACPLLGSTRGTSQSTPTSMLDHRLANDLPGDGKLLLE